MMTYDGGMSKQVGPLNGYIATQRFLRDHPTWLPILAAAIKEAKRTKEHGFAGAWVLQEVQETSSIKWLPNLRPLVSAGILKRTEISRGGKRAYYIMLDVQGVEKAVREIEK